MRKFRSAVVAFLIPICALVALIYFFNPTLFHSLVWHSKKTVQSIYLHEVRKMEIPLINQTKNLNCEAATAVMILNYYGKNMTVDDVQNALPLNSNPHKGFRGHVDGNIWGFDDYGVYAEPIAKVMTDLGVPSKAYTNVTEDFLKQKILSGKPAIIWVNIANPRPVARNVEINGEKVKLISGEHVAVVTGYENGTWILNDPWRTTGKDGKPQAATIKVDDLNSIMWDKFDHMAVIVE